MSDELKRVPLCEELVAITDDIKEAIVLRQMLYWLPRMDDVDKYLEEEVEPRTSDTDIPLSHGWVYKTGETIANETMIGSHKTGRRRLSALVEKGFLLERENPHQKWDRTKQYRVDVRAIESALQEEGYTLRTVVGKDWPVLKRMAEKACGQGGAPDSQPETSSEQPVQSREPDVHAIPETTTKTTTERVPARGEEESDEKEDTTDDPPTIDRVLELAQLVQVPETMAKDFYYYYEANGWKDFNSLRAALQRWKVNEHKYSTGGAPTDSTRDPGRTGVHASYDRV